MSKFGGSGYEWAKYETTSPVHARVTIIIFPAFNSGGGKFQRTFRAAIRLCFHRNVMVSMLRTTRI